MSVNLLIFSIRILLSHTILHMSGCRSLSHTEMYAKLKKAIKCMFAFQCLGWHCPDFIFCGIIYMHQASSQRQCIWGKFLFFQLFLVETLNSFFTGSLPPP